MRKVYFILVFLVGLLSFTSHAIAAPVGFSINVRFENGMPAGQMLVIDQAFKSNDLNNLPLYSSPGEASSTDVEGNTDWQAEQATQRQVWIASRGLNTCEVHNANSQPMGFQSTTKFYGPYTLAPAAQGQGQTVVIPLINPQRSDSSLDSDALNFVWLVNQARQDLELDPLSIDITLGVGLAAHLDWLNSLRGLSHCGNQGSSISFRTVEGGYQALTGAEVLVQKGISTEAFEWFKTSPSHWNALMAADVTCIGVARIAPSGYDNGYYGAVTGSNRGWPVKTCGSGEYGLYTGPPETETESEPGQSDNAAPAVKYSPRMAAYTTVARVKSQGVKRTIAIQMQVRLLTNQGKAMPNQRVNICRVVGKKCVSLGVAKTNKYGIAKINRKVTIRSKTLTATNTYLKKNWGKVRHTYNGNSNYKKISKVASLKITR